jgi:hypothetical protein
MSSNQFDLQRELEYWRFFHSIQSDCVYELDLKIAEREEGLKSVKLTRVYEFDRRKRATMIIKQMEKEISELELS